MWIKKRISNLARLLISLILIMLIISNIALESLISTLHNTNITYLLVALVTFQVFNIGSAYRYWYLFKSITKSDISILTVVKTYYFGAILNTVLPGSVTGDLGKALRMSRDSGFSKKISMMITLLERIVGLSALMVYFFIGSIYYSNIIKEMLQTIQIDYSIILLLFTIMLLIIFIVILNFKQKLMVYSKLIKINLRFIFTTFLISLVLQFINIATSYFLYKSVNTAIPLSGFLFIVPTINILVILPVTFMGIGLREISGIMLYGLFGASSDKVLATNILGYLFLALNNIIGLIILNINKQTFLKLNNHYD